MKIKFTLFLFLIVVLVKVEFSYAQNTWRSKIKMNSLLGKKDIYQKKNFPSTYEI